MSFLQQTGSILTLLAEHQPDQHKRGKSPEKSICPWDRGYQPRWASVLFIYFFVLFTFVGLLEGVTLGEVSRQKALS